MWNSRSIGKMKTKLGMWDLGKNIGYERKCICKLEEETTEYVVECGGVREELNIGKNDIWSNEYREKNNNTLKHCKNSRVRLKAVLSVIGKRAL